MNLYWLSEADDPEILGHYPQAKSSEDKRGHFDGFDSPYRMNWFEFPNFTPKYGIDLHPKAIPTDIIHKTNLSFGLVVGEKFKKLLAEFNLPTHRFYPIDVNGTNRNYYWFHYITDIWEHVDFTSTKINIFHKFKFTLEDTKKFNSFADIMQFERNLPRQYFLRLGNIRLYDSFQNYDLFEVTGPQHVTLISEELKKRLLSEDISGIRTEKYDKIEFSEKSNPSANSHTHRVNWSDFKVILDSIQIASTHKTGIQNLKALVAKMNSDTMLIQKNGIYQRFTNESDLQKFIDKYDSNIKVSDIK